MAAGDVRSYPLDANLTLSLRVSEATARLWAKSDPPYALWRHLLDVAAVAHELLTVFPLAAIPDPLIAAIVGLHDVGKADPLFQLKVPVLATQVGDEYFGPLRTGWTHEVAAFRHEARSARVVIDLLVGERFGWSRAIANAVGRAVRGHHGNFGATLTPEDQYPGAIAARWRDVRRELCDMVIDVVGAQPASEPSITALDVFGVRLSALIVAADWIASNGALFRVGALDDNPARHWAVARDAARTSLSLLGVARPRRARFEAPSWSDLFGTTLTPRGVQQVVSAAEAPPIPPGLVIIEASTGEGKTEAALYLAEQWQFALAKAGVYFALPTQATSNDVHRRYTEFLQRTNPDAAPLLVHGMAWLADTEAQAGELDPASDASAAEQQREAAAWIRNARRALLAPHAVGTIDQVLLAALSVRFGFLRLMGLGTKVLVVDEVHACDTYMQERLGRVLRWCRAQETPVVLLSATLARSQRDFLVRCWYGEGCDPKLPEAQDYPLVTIAPFEIPATERAGAIDVRTLSPESRRQPPRVLGVDLTAFEPDAGRLGVEVEPCLTGAPPVSGCAALIVNTVKVAQRAFRALSAQLSDGRPALLFHSRFPAWRRLEIEREVRRLFGKDSALGGDRPGSALVVSTQVMEQSLDVDFDTMAVEVAPIDALLQRAGRLHRHDRRRSVDGAPRLSVLVPTIWEDEDASPLRRGVYDELLVLRTIAALQDRHAVSLPSDYRALIEAVYGEPNILDARIPPGRLEQARSAHAKAHARQLALAQQHLVGPPVADRFEYPNAAAPFAVAEADEGEIGNNLRAQTRDGSYTTAILALTRDVEYDALARYRRGARDVGTCGVLMEARVPVPAWWLRGAEATEQVEHHPAYRFGSDGRCEQLHALRFSPLEGVWMDDGE